MTKDNYGKKSSSDRRSVTPQAKVLVGYWHNWTSGGGDGYIGGTSANVKLSEVHEGYNIINVSFMKSTANGSIPTFIPNGMSDAQFRAEVDKLHSQGRTVLIALGGADAHIELGTNDENALTAEIIRLVDVYGFDGLDIDLEQAAIKAGHNQTVLPAALKKVKDHFREKGEDFLITMAPEFPYLRGSSHPDFYQPYIKSLEGYYDWINPQFYNQAGDGISSDTGWVAQNDDSKKAEFLYALTKAIVTGEQTYIKIPADKFAIGIPANNDAAANGYVINPEDVQSTLDKLKNEGNEIKGLMTWSVNWDAGKSRDGISYNNEFVETYAPMLFDPNPDPSGPSVPKGLKSTAQTETSISLEWTLNPSSENISKYDIYRNGSKVGSSPINSYIDKGLSSKTEYTYYLIAVDAANKPSKSSSSIKVSTKGDGPTPSEDEWDPNNHSYATGDIVSYLGHKYKCIQAHTSNAGWDPVSAITLWEKIS
ncbi:MAG: glycosyl hydrolase family 18 protein [Dysgonomonas sp.]|uniref:glycosyl hydrolase family 18 protein n=1 Tax=Dysgonomonas sp. TaxID=1891233 RepID=UPI0039E569A4